MFPAKRQLELIISSAKQCREDTWEAYNDQGNISIDRRLTTPNQGYHRVYVYLTLLNIKHL